MGLLRQLLFPSDDRKFFRMLVELSNQVFRGATIFKDFIDTYERLSEQERSQRVADIKELEHRCDELSHIIIMRLNSSNTHIIHMQTIQAAASLLATIMDGISTASRRLILFRVAKTNAEVQQFAVLIFNSCKELFSLMQQLHDMENIHKTIIRIHGIEREADYIYNLAMAALFEEKHDAKVIIIFKDIYDILENVIDNAEYTARAIENMIAKDRSL